MGTVEGEKMDFYLRMRQDQQDRILPEGRGEGGIVRKKGGEWRNKEEIGRREGLWEGWEINVVGWFFLTYVFLIISSFFGLFVFAY